MAIGQGNVWTGKQPQSIAPKKEPTSPVSVYKPGVYTGNNTNQVSYNLPSSNTGSKSSSSGSRRKSSSSGSSSQNNQANASNQVSKQQTQVLKVQEAINKPKPQSIDPQAQALAYKKQQETKEVSGYYVEDVYNRQTRPLYQSEYEESKTTTNNKQTEIKDNTYSPYKVYKKEPEKQPVLVAKGDINSWSSVGRQLEQQQREYEQTLKAPNSNRGTMTIAPAPTKQQIREYEYFKKTTKGQPTFDYMPSVALYSGVKLIKGYGLGLSAPFRPKFYTEELPGLYQFGKGLFTGETIQNLQNQNIAETLRNNPYKTGGFVAESVGYTKGFSKTKALIKKVNPIKVNFGKNVKLTSFSRGGYKNLFEVKFQPLEVTFRPSDKFGVPYSQLTPGPVKSGLVVSRKGASSSKYADTYRAVTFKNGEVVKVTEAQIKPITMDRKAVVSRNRPNIRTQQQRVSKVVQRKQNQGLQGYGRRITRTPTGTIERLGKGREIQTQKYYNPESKEYIEKNIAYTKQRSGFTETITTPSYNPKKNIGSTGYDYNIKAITIKKGNTLQKAYLNFDNQPQFFKPKGQSTTQVDITKLPYKYKGLSGVTSEKSILQLTQQKYILSYEKLKIKPSYKLKDIPKQTNLVNQLYNFKKDIPQEVITKNANLKPVTDIKPKVSNGFRPGMKERLINKLKERYIPTQEYQQAPLYKPETFNYPVSTKKDLRPPFQEEIVYTNTLTNAQQGISSNNMNGISQSVGTTQQLGLSQSQILGTTQSQLLGNKLSFDTIQQPSELGLPKLSLFTENQVKLTYRQATITEQKPATITAQYQEVAQEQAQTQVQEQKQEQKPVVIFDNGRSRTKDVKIMIKPIVKPIVPITEIKVPERPMPFKPIPKTPEAPRIKPFRFQESKQELLAPGFNVFVKKYGKLEKVNLRPLTLQDAFKKGQYVVGNTARASFKITNANEYAKEKFTGGAVFPQDFYKSSSGFFVEKRERRIKSTGELQEITFKGISSRRKKGFNFFKR